MSKRKDAKDKPGELVVISQQEWDERKTSVLLECVNGLPLPNVDVSSGDIDEPLEFLK